MDKTENKTLPKDPSLKRYFKYMLVNRKMSVQFTSKKIREIIENDLNIKLDEQNSLYTRICIDAFAYYMQSWPEWNVAVKSVYSDELYECLIKYLKGKLEYLKKREDMFTEANKEKNVLNVPEYLLNLPEGSQTYKKVALQINIPEKLWSNTQIAFNNFNNTDLILELEKTANSSFDFQPAFVINHPYVCVEFKVPGLIHLQRSTPFKIKRFLHGIDVPVHFDHPFITSVEQRIKINEPKVYTCKLLEAFIRKLKLVLETTYNISVSPSKRKEILSIFNSFLSDVIDSNISDSTVCEGYVVDYNISNKSYFVSKCIESGARENTLVYKKIYIPMVSYSMLFCTLTREDINENGDFNYFKFIDEEDKNGALAFLQYIIISMRYKCIICDTNLNLLQLRKHLKETHPLDSAVQCTKCYKIFATQVLLMQRWNHECTN